MSSESVYQHSFVEWNGTSLNSGRKMETNVLIAATAGGGIVNDSAGESGTDHCFSWVKGVPVGAG